jgi:hypothetical protein
MLLLETKLYEGKLLPQSDLQWGVFPEEMSCRRYEEQKKHHSYKIATWNIRSLNQGGKLESLKTKMRKKHLSILGVSEARWKGQGEIRRGDYTVFYSRGKRAERGVAMVVYKSIVRSDV